MTPDYSMTTSITSLLNQNKFAEDAKKKNAAEQEFIAAKEALYARIEFDMKTSATPALHQRLLAIDAKNFRELKDIDWLFNNGKWRSADELNDVKRACIYKRTCRYFSNKFSRSEFFWDLSHLWLMPLSWYLCGLIAGFIDCPSFYLECKSVPYFIFLFTFDPFLIPIIASFDIPLFIIPLLIGIGFRQLIIHSRHVKGGYNEKELRNLDRLTSRGVEFHRFAIENVLCPFIGFDKPVRKRRNPVKPPLFHRVFNLRYMKSELKNMEWQ